MKRIVLFILIVSFAGVLFSQEDVMEKIYTLYQNGKFSEALELVEKEIAANGEVPDMLQAKFYLLSALEREDEALQVALRQEEISEKKSPWICLDITTVYAKKKDPEQTLFWLEEAVNRGYNGYQDLMAEQYRFLEKEKRFQKIVNTMKNNIGLDQPAKDFTVDLISGKTFTLSENRGKVILVDFWATWCGPCRAEMPNLKKIYDEFHAKGFEIIGIGLDGEKESLEYYVKEEKLGWEIAYSGKAWDDETAKVYGVNSIPSFWLVDKKGILRHFGLQGEALHNAVSELIHE